MAEIERYVVCGVKLEITIRGWTYFTMIASEMLARVHCHAVYSKHRRWGYV